jgi:hypothetical protein
MTQGKSTTRGSSLDIIKYKQWSLSHEVIVLEEVQVRLRCFDVALVLSRSVRSDTKCPARRSVSSATPSVRCDAECQAQHRVSDTMTLNYTMSSIMLTRHIKVATVAYCW